jgi:hypothetical protein
MFESWNGEVSGAIGRPGIRKCGTGMRPALKLVDLYLGKIGEA